MGLFAVVESGWNAQVNPGHGVFTYLWLPFRREMVLPVRVEFVLVPAYKGSVVSVWSGRNWIPPLMFSLAQSLAVACRRKPDAGPTVAGP